MSDLCHANGYHLSWRPGLVGGSLLPLQSCVLLWKIDVL